MHYSREKISRMIASLAMVYGIPAERWFLTYGTAMVVHGLSSSTGDIDITLGQEDWAAMSTYHDVNTDSLGPIIELPGKVEIRPMSTIMTTHEWCRRHSTMVATLESLRDAYEWMLVNPVDGRNKGEADRGNLNRVLMKIDAEKDKTAHQITQVLSTVMSDAVSMIVQLEASKLFDIMGDEVHRATIKDDSHSKWGVKVHPKAKAVEFWEISEIDMDGNVEIHSIKFDKRVGKAT